MAFLEGISVKCVVRDCRLVSKESPSQKYRSGVFFLLSHTESQNVSFLTRILLDSDNKRASAVRRKEEMPLSPLCQGYKSQTAPININ